MPGYDETIPPPPRDPVEEAARQAKLRELEAKLTELEARAAESADPTRDVADSQHADSEGAVRAAEAKTAQGPRRPPSPKCGICGHPRADHSPQHAPGFSPGICHDCTYESGMRTHEFLAVLRWGEGVTSDTSRTGQEVGVPVCDDDGRQIGEMRMGYANAGVFGAMLTDASRSGEPIHAWIKEHAGDLPEWQLAWLDHIMQMRSRERRRARYEANAAFQRGMQIASGRDVPPLPATDLPTRVDDLTSDTYDQLRARYAWLEQRYRDTVDSEQGAVVVRQAKEIGELRAKIGEYDTAIGFEVTCLGCSRNLDASLREMERAEKAEAGIARVRDVFADWQGSDDTYGNFAKAILAALDGDTPKETT